MLRTLVIAVPLSGFAAMHAGDDLLWDNDIEPNGFNGRAISPPTFPDIRVADDFRVSDASWRVQQLVVKVIEDGSWQHGDEMTFFIYADADGSPGDVLVEAVGPFDRSVHPRKCDFSRDCFTYWFDVGDLELTPGRYWIGPRNHLGAGAGTNYWATSNGGQGADTTAWFSLDAGVTWMDEGPDWHHAFEIRGVVLGCSADVDKDGVVGWPDLLRVLAAWGPCDDCPEDVDNDDDVGMSDLLRVLDAWGECP